MVALQLEAAALTDGQSVLEIGSGSGYLLALMGAQARIHGSGMRARPFENRALVARRVERYI